MSDASGGRTRVAGLFAAAAVAVVWVGAIKAILFAVTLALLRFVRLVARPPVEILGQVDGMAGSVGPASPDGLRRFAANPTYVPILPTSATSAGCGPVYH